MRNEKDKKGGRYGQGIKKKRYFKEFGVDEKQGGREIGQ